MGRSAKADYQAIIESKLSAHPDGLPLDELLERSGLKVDRSTLFRHLARLIETGRAERIGDARASRYRFLGVAPIPTPLAPPFAQRAEPVVAPIAAPDHDAVVKKAVRTIVREWKRFDRVNLQIYLSLMVKPEHLDEVAAAVESELDGLHEGNLDRFGLSPADLAGFIPPASPETTVE